MVGLHRQYNMQEWWLHWCIIICIYWGLAWLFWHPGIHPWKSEILPTDAPVTNQAWCHLKLLTATENISSESHSPHPPLKYVEKLPMSWHWNILNFLDLVTPLLLGVIFLVKITPSNKMKQVSSLIVFCILCFPRCWSVTNQLESLTVTSFTSQRIEELSISLALWEMMSLLLL